MRATGTPRRMDTAKIRPRRLPGRDRRNGPSTEPTPELARRSRELEDQGMRGWCGFGLAALLVGLSIGAAVTDAQEAGPPSDRVVEQRLVAIEDGIPLSLSPDGRWLAVE